MITEFNFVPSCESRGKSVLSIPKLDNVFSEPWTDSCVRFFNMKAGFCYESFFQLQTIIKTPSLKHFNTKMEIYDLCKYEVAYQMAVF